MANSTVKRIEKVELQTRDLAKEIRKVYFLMAVIGLCWFVVIAAFVATMF